MELYQNVCSFIKRLMIYYLRSYKDTTTIFNYHIFVFSISLITEPYWDYSKYEILTLYDWKNCTNSTAFFA